jgi:outer membrane biosynthesis protein TonB
MKTTLKMGLAVALLSLVAGCGSEAPSHDNHAAGNEQNIVDNSMIVDPEIPNAAVQTNVAAVPEPAVEPAVTKEPAAVKAAPPPPAAPKAAPKADAPKAAPKVAPKPEPSPPAKAECLPEHRAAGHC